MVTMLPLQNLKDQVESRFRRISNAHPGTVDSEIGMVRGWIRHQPDLMFTLIDAETAEPGLDFTAWNEIAKSDEFSWAARTEAGRAWLIWQLVNLVADLSEQGGNDHLLEYSYRFQREGVRGLRAITRQVVDHLLQPLFEFLQDRVQSRSTSLLAIARYVARVEWFDRKKVFQKYEDAVKENGRGEDALNHDLRRFLFMDAGILTHAEEKTASGEPDLTAILADGEKLVCEGKIFDGDGRGKSYLAKGIRQLIEYAKDLRLSTAHLVIYNISDRLLRLPCDSTFESALPSVDESGVKVYIHQVRLGPPLATASKLGKAEVVVVSRSDLITTDSPISTDL